MFKIFLLFIIGCTPCKKIINTDKAPKPIGPYSQAVLSKNMLFVSGQIAINPQTGQMVSEDVQSQTKQVMENIKYILSASNLDFKNVLKTTIYITDMNNFAKVNEIYSQYFSENYPARETVAVKELPKKALVEISVIAHK